MFIKLNKLYKFYKDEFNLSNYSGATKLCLGCGNKPLSGFINVDLYNKTFADEIVDLNEKLPYADESIEVVYSDNVFEHIENILQLMQECNRILKKGGFLIIRVPYFRSRYAYIDPTHKHFFTLGSMNYYVKDSYFYNNYKFFEPAFESVVTYFDPENKGFWKKIISAYAIKRMDSFENSILSSMFIFKNIIYVLKK